MWGINQMSKGALCGKTTAACKLLQDIDLSLRVKKPSEGVYEYSGIIAGVRGFDSNYKFPILRHNAG